MTETSTTTYQQVRAAISNAYYGARNAGFTMEQAADDAASSVLALVTSIASGRQPINVIFDGPPSHESGRFVEVELDNGCGVRVGEWIERPDGFWSLRIAELPIAEQVSS